MARSSIALATEDFDAYHDLSQRLQAEDLAFESISPGTPVPEDVEVVITTADERGAVAHDRVVVYSTPQATVEEAIRLLRGLEDVARLVIGVDPGKRPGLAVLADGHVLSTRSAADPDRVVDEVKALGDRYGGAEVVVRIGHGARTLRDRIVNGVLEAGFAVELVDETSSSPPRRRVAGERDKVAARVIAMTAGQVVETQTSIEVPPGRIREIQRRSRIESDGAVTISRALADKVAVGALSLSEAVRRQCRETTPT